MREAGAGPERELVLVGGGHAHVQVLRSFAMRREPGVRLTVVLDRPEAVYSGMVPALVAGDVRAAELEIDVVPLARRAGARVVLAAATQVDPDARSIALEGRPPLRFDVASLDVGSSVRDLTLPGVREHTLPTRPIRGLVDRLDAALAARAPVGRPLRVVVVGGGAAGLELAFTLGARLRASGREIATKVVCASSALLPGQPARVVRRVAREAERAGIEIACGARVVAAEPGALVLEGGRREAADLALWATGAAPPPLLAASPLPLDADGFVRVGATLEVEGAESLFAVGDCASLDGHPSLPKAGVYAVRQGPVLTRNLRARLRGARLERYRPQRDFLALLNLGGRRALLAKWGVVAAGRGVWRLKDRIDRRFVRRFSVLDSAGAAARGFPAPARMDAAPMPCGGCAAKVGAGGLARALGRLPPAPADASVRMGLERPDDAAALALSGGELLLATLDGFRAFCGDAWLVGRVAAVNAVSDVFAKGGSPRHALALVSVPDAAPERAEETLFQALAGVRAALDPLGVSLVGGHSTTGSELFVGLAVTGHLNGEGSLLRLAGARSGQALVLSKALGTGVVLAADMQGLATGAWLTACHAAMLRHNGDAARVARAHGASACTDVSGFGLAGHLGALLRASGLTARIETAALPALPGALGLLARGMRSTAHVENARERRAVAGAPAAGSAGELLYDPQTSGGLLFALPRAAVPAALGALHAAGDAQAACIGELLPARDDGIAIELV